MNQENKDREYTFRQQPRGADTGRSLEEMERDIKKSKKEFAKALDKSVSDVHRGLNKLLGFILSQWLLQHVG